MANKNPKAIIMKTSLTTKITSVIWVGVSSNKLPMYFDSKSFKLFGSAIIIEMHAVAKR